MEPTEVDVDELIEFWTLLDEDRELLAGKRGSTALRGHRGEGHLRAGEHGDGRGPRNDHHRPHQSPQGNRWAGPVDRAAGPHRSPPWPTIPLPVHPTGTPVPLLQDKVGPTGTIIGIDASSQMLAVADRITAHGRSNVG